MSAVASGLAERAAASQFPPTAAQISAAQTAFGFSLEHDIEEICLALACNDRNNDALATFEDDYISCGRAALRSAGFAAHIIEDSLQRLRSELLVARTNEDFIALVKYAGHGRLRSLVRVSATRYAKYLVTYVEKGSSTVAARIDAAGPSSDFITELWSTDDPETHVIQSDLAAQFKTCFQEALLALPHEDRAILRLYYVQTLSLAQLGKLFSVDKSTMSRRLTTVRTRLLKQIRRRWPNDTADVTELLDGELDLSMSRLLRSQESR